MLKILGGKYKRTNLVTPKGKLLRPTSGLKKQAIFNIIINKFNKINNQSPLNNKIVLDAYAGSGNLGIESMSYGAKYCYFIENNELIFQFLEKNCNKILKANTFKIIKSKYDKLSILEIKKEIDIVFLDPPYNLNINKNVFDIIILNNKKIPFFVVETESKTKLPKINNLYIIDERFFGKTKITFLKGK
tara:strand:- start:2421 stop:2987 length:567 start_codon:yes stop_codon:yes gene_type:complete